MANIITVQSVVTKTSTFNGSSIPIDNTVFPNTPDWTLVVEVQSTGPDTIASFCFADSVNAFTNELAGPRFDCPGGVSVRGGGKRFCLKREDLPSFRFGYANAVLRLELINISGTNPTVTYSAWLEA